VARLIIRDQDRSKEQKSDRRSAGRPVRTCLPAAISKAGEIIMQVKDAMHPGVTWAGPETNVRELVRKMRDEDIGSIPIGENDRLIGMVTDRDIAIRGLGDGRDIETLTARDVMTGPIIYCRADEEVGDAVRIMEEHQVRRLPVIDAAKRMVGMLALGDIADSAPRDLSAEVVQAVSAHHP
jgi:predicted transcriptional regulator